MNEIRFYRPDDEYGFLSNFSRFRIFVAGDVWPTVEHYFQSQKFDNPELRKMIQQIPHPMDAAREGRRIENDIRTDWEEVKDEIMFNGLFVKFTQHLDLRDMLLNTGKSLLVEHTENDSYWGDGGDGKGVNMLGKLLVKVRENIIGINGDPNVISPPWVAFTGMDSEAPFWLTPLGENYMAVWSRYYLSLEDRKTYHELFPEPNDWSGMYLPT